MNQETSPLAAPGASRPLAPRNPPLCCFHGFSGGPSSWAALSAQLSLPTRCLSLPGHRPSSHMPHPAGFEASADLLLPELPEHAASWVGYSLGARIALSLALRHPGRCAKLALIGGNPGLEDPAARAARARWDEAWAVRFESEPRSEVLADWGRLPIFDSQRQLPQEVLRAQAEQRRAHSGAGLGAAMRSLGLSAMPSYWSRLSELPPTLFVAGALDQKYAQLGRRMRAAAPQLSLQLIPGAGHNPLLEQPAALAAVIEAWLA